MLPRSGLHHLCLPILVRTIASTSRHLQLNIHIHLGSGNRQAMPKNRRKLVNSYFKVMELFPGLVLVRLSANCFLELATISVNVAKSSTGRSSAYLTMTMQNICSTCLNCWSLGSFCSSPRMLSSIVARPGLKEPSS
ncbi:hypothetical protein B0J12DRAFT_373282 [Macrophomina phaseolina]|uniref:Secreted protein n=1 Tax=Macrophomina phaseolina TaxID=35725 RepID=A0ABQ8GK57_9PEZI|nr:hypothetical protein B0J12DRAFT_373282 [Macrophomina phaseolina]